MPNLIVEMVEAIAKCVWQPIINCSALIVARGRMACGGAVGCLRNPYEAGPVRLRLSYVPWLRTSL
jgi:hypothetical protein